MSTHKPLFYERWTKKRMINYQWLELPVSNKFLWCRRCSSHWSWTVVVFIISAEPSRKRLAEVLLMSTTIYILCYGDWIPVADFMLFPPRETTVPVFFTASQSPKRDLISRVLLHFLLEQILSFWSRSLFRRGQQQFCQFFPWNDISSL